MALLKQTIATSVSSVTRVQERCMHFSGCLSLGFREGSFGLRKGRSTSSVQEPAQTGWQEDCEILIHFLKNTLLIYF